MSAVHEQSLHIADADMEADVDDRQSDHHHEDETIKKSALSGKTGDMQSQNRSRH